VYKVWWGNQPARAERGDLSHVAGVNMYSSLHPRKLFVSGLTKVHSDADVDLRRAELERAFRKYGGDRGVQVIVPANATYAFVEMESERQADLALNEMSDNYRLNRARRSRHEALQEERAAKEAAAAAAAIGATVVVAAKDTKDWD
jgi:RNA recognition motif-containing protein